METDLQHIIVQAADGCEGQTRHCTTCTNTDVRPFGTDRLDASLPQQMMMKAAPQHDQTSHRLVQRQAALPLLTTRFCSTLAITLPHVIVLVSPLDNPA